jgi:hypothetical protein
VAILHFEVTKVSHIMAVTGLADGRVAPWLAGGLGNGLQHQNGSSAEPNLTIAALRNTPVVSDTYQRLNGRWNARNAPSTADNSPSRTPPEPLMDLGGPF